MSRTMLGATIALLIVTITSCSGPKETLTQEQLPGRLPDGRVLLPNGWYLSPAGTQIEDIGDLPLNIAISPDERYALVVNNGQGRQTVVLVDLRDGSIVQSVPIARSWLGVRFIGGGAQCVVSGGTGNRVFIYDVDSTGLQLADSIVIGEVWPKEKIWVAGLDVDEATATLYAATRQSAQLFIIDMERRSVGKALPLPARPYTCLVSKVHNVVYVSLWGGAAVAVVDRSTGEIIHTIDVGLHPNDMVESPDGSRLFVANANENTVSVIDANQWKVTETLSSALVPNAPPGSTPNSVALNGEGTRLYIANADNNALAVMDVSKPGNARSLGFIPVGWYPTCVRVTGSNGRIIVANGKGAGSKANPGGPNAGISGSYDEYIAHLFGGTLSLIDEPTKSDLQRLSEKVYANARYPGQGTRSPEEPNPVPRAVGDQSPIKYVFYIIKENRTYDQVFGDMPRGNGDSTLCLFPERVTPNHHALAREFVLLDNFYVDAEVSADGHNWSMGAYATDYVEKTWPTLYGGRGGEYEYAGGTPIVYPPEGYIWDNCRRHGVTFRSYGEFVINAEQPGDSTKAAIEGLEGHVAPFYRGWDMDYSDVFRAKDWMREFDEFERNDSLPRFQIIYLPNDHTEGTRIGKLTPFAYAAQNDQALGMVVQRISNSKFWRESAIFVVEDDAQNGPDHVDAHRTVALVISPYTKWGYVDSELYSTSSMLRTMELILGLPPMTQFDASATPMYNSFTTTPEFTPYRLREAQVDIYEKNKAGAYGQARSEELNFSREDAVPDVEFNEILWKSIRGADSPMPSPVRSAFVRVIDEDDDD